MSTWMNLNVFLTRQREYDYPTMNADRQAKLGCVSTVILFL